MSHLRNFGCIAYAYVPETKRKKLDDRGEKCIFIRYNEESMMEICMCVAEK